MNRSLPRKVPFKQWQPDYKTQEDIVTFKVVQSVQKTGEGDEDFIVIDKVVEDSRVNRQKKYNELGADRDIYSIIRKVEDTGDLTLLNSGVEGQFLDVSELPENGQELNERLSKAVAVWEQLDPELKGKLSLPDFLKSLTDEKLEAYFSAKEKSLVKDKDKVDAKEGDEK